MTAAAPMQIRLYLDGELCMSARVACRHALLHARAEMLAAVAAHPGALWCFEVHNPAWDNDCAIRMGTDVTPMLDPHPVGLADLLAIALPEQNPPGFRPCFVDASRAWMPDPEATP